jgi:hypothetical protein
MSSSDKDPEESKRIIIRSPLVLLLIVIWLMERDEVPEA